MKVKELWAQRRASSVSVNDRAGELSPFDGLGLYPGIQYLFPPRGSREMPCAIASSVDPSVDTFQGQNSCSTTQGPAPDAAGPANEDVGVVVNAGHEQVSQVLC